MFDLLRVAMSSAFYCQTTFRIHSLTRCVHSPWLYSLAERAATLVARSHPPLAPFFISSLAAAGVAPLSRKHTRDGRIISIRCVWSILLVKKTRSCVRAPSLPVEIFFRALATGRLNEFRYLTLLPRDCREKCLARESTNGKVKLRGGGVGGEKGQRNRALRSR